MNNPDPVRSVDTPIRIRSNPLEKWIGLYNPDCTKIPTNDITFEARKNETLWTCRLDLTITSLEGVKWSTSHGYGELKSTWHEANNFLLSKDLIWVAIFCKSTLYAQKLGGYSRVANHWTIHGLLSPGVTVRRPPLCHIWIRDSPGTE